MKRTERDVQTHYAIDGLGESLLRALVEDGKDLDHLTVADLAPVDEFHIRGQAATLELAGVAGIGAAAHVLDVGCGLGGSARFLASEYGCRVTGLDMTADYCEVGTMLSSLVGLDDRTNFRHGSALAMPFEDGAFDVAWTEHVQMNIADKRAFYGEIARVLRPQGRLVFHDIFAGSNGEPHFPVPWAEQLSLSHLVAPDEAATILGSLGFDTVEWRDVTADALTWIRGVRERARPRVGIHLLMKSTAPDKLINLHHNLEEGRVSVCQAVLDKRVDT